MVHPITCQVFFESAYPFQTVSSSSWQQTIDCLCPIRKIMWRGQKMMTVKQMYRQTTQQLLSSIQDCVLILWLIHPGISNYLETNDLLADGTFSLCRSSDCLITSKKVYKICSVCEWMSDWVIWSSPVGTEHDFLSVHQHVFGAQGPGQLSKRQGQPWAFHRPHTEIL